MPRNIVTTDEIEEIKVENQKPLWEATGDDAFKTVIEREADNQGDSLIAFVEKQVLKMNEKILFDGQREPSLYELDMALSTYEQTMFGLIAMYEQAKYDAQVAKEAFEEFYAEKFMEVRNKYNTIDVRKGQWLSSSEIEYTTKSIFKKELAALKAAQMRKDVERSTLERLMKSWESYQFVLLQLSKNTIADIGASGMTVDMYKGDEVADPNTGAR
jgi:hypothetical protein